MRPRATWVVAALALASLAAAASAPPDAVALQGSLTHPASLREADLQRLPATSVRVGFATEHGTEQAIYTGTLLWTLLAEAGPVDAPGRRTHLQHTILIRGQDGYAVALAIGEIDPAFEGKAVILAYAKDGTQMPSLRLVVPGDRRGGRSVKDVVAIELR